MADDTATVTVPRELLREVLKDALEDNASLMVGVSKDRHPITWQFCDKHRARIAELRRLAGMEE